MGGERGKGNTDCRMAWLRIRNGTAKIFRGFGAPGSWYSAGLRDGMKVGELCLNTGSADGTCPLSDTRVLFLTMRCSLGLQG